MGSGVGGGDGVLLDRRHASAGGDATSGGAIATSARTRRHRQRGDTAPSTVSGVRLDPGLGAAGQREVDPQPGPVLGPAGGQQLLAALDRRSAPAPVRDTDRRASSPAGDPGLRRRTRHPRSARRPGRRPRARRPRRHGRDLRPAQARRRRAPSAAPIALMRRATRIGTLIRRSSPRSIRGRRKRAIVNRPRTPTTLISLRAASSNGVPATVVLTDAYVDTMVIRTGRGARRSRRGRSSGPSPCP